MRELGCNRIAWEQRKLGEMGQTYTGLSGKTKDDFGHGQAQFVTYMNVFSNPISNPEMTEPIEIDPKQNEVEVGDVFFTTSSETPEEVGMSSVLLGFYFRLLPRQDLHLTVNQTSAPVGPKLNQFVVLAVS